MAGIGGSTGKDSFFDDEGRKLRASQKQERDDAVWRHLDPIWKHETGGGLIYVGDDVAARSLDILQAKGITRVVNCTGDKGFGTIPNYHPAKLKYYNFAIAQWSVLLNKMNISAADFIAPVFAFIEEGIRQGENVLVHCLAGAHRAGTTGCACLIHFAKMDDVTAIATARKLRPVISPIGGLSRFLERLHQDYQAAAALASPAAGAVASPSAASASP